MDGVRGKVGGEEEEEEEEELEELLLVTARTDVYVAAARRKHGLAASDVVKTHRKMHHGKDFPEREREK